MRIANRDSGTLVARREPFTGSNLRGGPRGTVGGFGLLPLHWRDRYQADRPDYVVWSYATPIAWHGRRGWIIPPFKYSQTTIRHLSHVSRNLSHVTRNLPA